ncbi:MULTISPECIES: ABC transporter substrate-binding protein [unclassified Schaalia]|uniref:ABC transporter substrate-binding protein n=1 Tax=unclassified Schaalia TaxID=2691889 RepID=UPI001E283565|nr:MULTISPECIES: ABC transporter substrate-binding protein [unclassified Schaalia]MCD4549256.1 ABC transporter substrate-binding protein [Schaalia sp. lx-260]MCD4557065.1 ABC transporter substrate-binding protein [Schaalia sp. lx-100]
MSRTRFAAAAACVAAVALTLSACGSGASSTSGSQSAAPAQSAASGPVGTLTAGVAYETTNYHPSNTSSALAMGTNWHVVEGLWERDLATGKVYKALAADDDLKKISDTEYEVMLREGAKFSDGTPVTAEDFVSSFKRTTADGNIYAGMVNFIDSVSAKDEKTVSIKLKSPFSLAKERLVVVKVVPTSASDEDLTKKPVGSGPYKYDSITDTEITAVPNEHYNGSRPATVAKLVWKPLKDDTARTTAAQDGTIDVMESVPADNASLLKNSGLTVDRAKGFGLAFMIFNTSKAPFNDARVRQAFHYALDLDKIVKNNMSGEAVAASSFLPEDHPNYHKAAVVYNHDVEKAKSLLAEAGVKDLSISLLTTDHPWVSNLAPQIKSDLEAIGVKVNLQALASASLYSDNLDVDNPTYDVAVAPGDPSVFGNDPALLMNWWLGDNVWTQKRSFWKVSDPTKFEAFKAIMDEAVTLEGAAQQKKWDEALDFVSREVPVYPLFHRSLLTAYNGQKVQNFKAIGMTGLSLLGATVTE